MKKWLTIFSVLACLMLFTAVPAFADNNMNRANNTPGDEIRNDVNTGINRTNRALGTDINRLDNGNTVNGNNYRTNNYRATAADDDGFDWGWLGLIGLIGLAGMRGRERDRDRA
ncbi:WGxxGxxG family protein [Paenibacillus harenae]|uniref:WGxxGxxG-CTERM domain-containing protein n=1 Tax=Paenibacillus harenae TaxID=306543 RepID=A0ABT9UAG3_PAEHA|nr:WGxxGxxG family protein [Paenibacillus harenae]MDQ0060850.1 hypothetical protein [Paenibacillus harenae]MDQ0115439.1 hypothetical protein [Paenibacillus harenae]